MNSKLIFANAMKKAIKNSGLKQIDVASKIEVNRSNVNRWLLAETLPSSVMLDRFCERLGLDLEIKFKKSRKNNL